MLKMKRLVVVLGLILMLIALYYIDTSTVTSTVTYDKDTITKEIFSEEEFYSSSLQAYTSGQVVGSRSKLKKVLYEEMVNRNNNITIKYNGYYDLDGSNFDNFVEMTEEVIEELVNEDHYLMHNAKSYQCNYQYTGKLNEYIAELNVMYRTTKEEEDYVDRRVDKILSQIITSDMATVDKVKAVHDYIISNVAYDLSTTKFTAYDALVSGKAVCQGYSLLGHKMLNKLGIPTRIISSQVMNHGWNLVNINDKWLHLDMTWDDPTPDEPGRVLYEYFLLTDAEIIEVDQYKDIPRSWTFAEYPTMGEGYNIGNVEFTLKENQQAKAKLSYEQMHIIY